MELCSNESSYSISSQKFRMACLTYFSWCSDSLYLLFFISNWILMLVLLCNFVPIQKWVEWSFLVFFHPLDKQLMLQVHHELNIPRCMPCAPWGTLNAFMLSWWMMSFQGVDTRRTYIAAQGPLSTTVSDFWRMLWQEKVKVVVIACNEFEGLPRKVADIFAPFITGDAHSENFIDCIINCIAE